MPLTSTEFPDRADVPVPLPQGSRRPWTQLGIASRRNEHSDYSTFTVLTGGFVHGTGVVRTVVQPRIQPNSAPDIETSRTCTDCASDTSRVLTPGLGLRVTTKLNQGPCTNAPSRREDPAPQLPSAYVAYRFPSISSIVLVEGARSR